jgi:hypothetical protein
VLDIGRVFESSKIGDGVERGASPSWLQGMHPLANCSVPVFATITLLYETSHLLMYTDACLGALKNVAEDQAGCKRALAHTLRPQSHVPLGERVRAAAAGSLQPGHAAGVCAHRALVAQFYPTFPFLFRPILRDF